MRCLFEKLSDGAERCVTVSKAYETLRMAVWDEACISNKAVVECLDRGMRDTCSCHLPFDSKILFFDCDFRQKPNEVQHESRVEVLSCCLSRSCLML